MPQEHCQKCLERKTFADINTAGKPSADALKEAFIILKYSSAACW